jgi:hypothetical protein
MNLKNELSLSHEQKVLMFAGEHLQPCLHTRSPPTGSLLLILACQLFSASQPAMARHPET